MLTYEGIYQGILNDLLEKNIQSLKISLDEDPEVNSKVKSWCERHDFPYVLARYSFHTSETFRHSLSKDPKKQNPGEMAFLAFLQPHVGENNITKLPNGGKGSLSVLAGLVSTAGDSKNIHKKAKTIDFIIKNAHSRKIYISHKRTDGETGGAQGNQEKDAESFLEEVRNNRDDSEIFIAVLDGDYYQKQNRLINLRTQYQRPNKIYVCTSDELVNTILPELNK